MKIKIKIKVKVKIKRRTALNRKIPIQVAINLVLAVIGINTRRFIENKNENK